MFDPTLPADTPQKLALQTRKGGTIENTMNPVEMVEGVSLKIVDLRTTYSSAIHRDVGPSARYNCHGLTFAARRTGIDSPAQIQRILADDGYEKLQFGQRPSIGDIAAYSESGDIVHSGIVVAIKDETPWILGKWGDCHEVIHAVTNCPYNKANVSYYRLLK